MTKTFGALALGLLLVAGCSQPKKPEAANDPFAGLDQAILTWKGDITASDASCKPKAAGQKCEMFEVSCKAQRAITPDEQARGVTAKVVADMSWNGFDKFGAPQSASAAALFEKANGAWTRTSYKPVNPESCADL